MSTGPVTREEFEKLEKRVLDLEVVLKAGVKDAVTDELQKKKAADRAHNQPKPRPSEGLQSR